MEAHEKQLALVAEIADLQQQQLTTAVQAQKRGWTPAEEQLAFDKTFSHIASLMRELAALRELDGTHKS